MLDRNGIAKRIAQELQDNWYVNLGIGIPTLIANYIPEGISVEFQSENGILGMGPFPFEGEEDADLINAGKQTVTHVTGASIFDSAESFSITFPEIEVMFITSLLDMTAKLRPSSIESKYSFIAEITTDVSMISSSFKEDKVNL